jgi:hypothetical protein
MGADLTCYILVAPKTLSKHKLVKAQCRLEEVNEQLAELVGRMQVSAAIQIEDIIDKSRRLSLLKRTLNRICDCEGYDTLDDALTELRDTLHEYPPGDFMEKIKEVWNHEYRDVTSRNMPGAKSKMILVAGKTSWGEGYEEDTGAWWIGRMEWFDLLTLLGVK